MCAFKYEWRSVDNTQPIQNDFDHEPFSTWTRLRQSGTDDANFLVELPVCSSIDTQALSRLGKVTPAAYVKSGQRFFTVRTVKANPETAEAETQAPGQEPVPVVRGSRMVGADSSSRLAASLLARGPHADAGPRPFAATRAPAAVARDPSEPVSQPPDSPTPPVLAVIDTTCAFLHRQFCRPGDAMHTRILAVWDQTEGAPMLDPWKEVEGFGYGREIDDTAIDALLKQSVSPGQSQRSVYTAVGQNLPARSDPWSHGTHVLAIAGGAIDSFAVPVARADEASQLRLIAIQLPQEAVGHTHGIWLNIHVLDGIHFALHRAPPDSPVIVNISMAGGLGPHDGTSVLERAIDALVDAWGGRLTVVLAGGNNRLDEMHTVVRIRHDQPVDLELVTISDDGTPNFVDMWTNDSNSEDLRLTLSVRNGNGALAEVALVAPGQCLALFPVVAGGKVGPVAMACMSRSGMANNGSGLQAFLGVAAVIGNTAAAAAPRATWAIALSSQGAELNLDAWLGRDDIPAGFPGIQRQIKFSRCPAAVPGGTLSSLGGGQRSIVVGAYEARVGNAMSMYKGSGEGGGRFRLPDVCGATSVPPFAGAPDVCFYSDRVQPTVDGNTRKGTSIAAPFVARRLANVLAREGGAWLTREPLLEQLRSAYGGAPATPLNATAWTANFWVRA